VFYHVYISQIKLGRLPLEPVDHSLGDGKTQHAYLNKRCSSADYGLNQKQRPKDNTNSVPAPAKP
jgi:hypothetical protein